MNRHQRRRKKAMEKSNNFVDGYVRHLPETDVDALLEPGVSHVVFEHDDWCDFYSGRGAVCNCSPKIRHYKEPTRS